MKYIKYFWHILSYLLLLCIVGIISYSLYKSDEPVSVVYGNKTHSPLNFILNKTNDTISKMLIRDKENACEVVLTNGETWFFAEPGDMIIWLNEKSFRAKAYEWVYTIDTNRWIEAHIAWYGVRDKTIMGYGFAAREHQCKECINYQEMRRKMLHGETLLNPRIRKHLLEDLYEK